MGLRSLAIVLLSYHSQWYPQEAAKYKLPAAQVLSLIEAQELSALSYLSLHRQRAALQASWKATLAENQLDAVAFLVSLSDPPARDNPELSSPLTNPENAKLLTFLFSYLGFPVVTIPGGTSSTTHLPVGIQLGGAPFSEAKLIQLAVDLQAHFPHYQETPSFGAAAWKDEIDARPHEHRRPAPRGRDGHGDASASGRRRDEHGRPAPCDRHAAGGSHARLTDGYGGSSP